MEIKLDECFQFGLGAFETIAVEKGQPVFLEKHLERLERTLRFLGLRSGSERENNREMVMEYLKEQRERYSDGLSHCALKMMISGENILFKMRPNPYKAGLCQHGFTMDFSKVRRNETSPLVYHKTMNYGDCILEKRKAAANGMDERIFLNTKGQIAEGTVSNIFFIRQGQIITPAQSCGLLPGILREYICETERVTEAIIYPEELDQYEECFVTNSLMGIMPVRRLGEYIFPEQRMTKQLRKKYFDKLAEGESNE